MLQSVLFELRMAFLELTSMVSVQACSACRHRRGRIKALPSY